MRAASNDNGHEWELSGPDGAGNIWLEWTRESRRERFNLGPRRAVETYLARWLAEPDVGWRSSCRAGHRTADEPPTVRAGSSAERLANRRAG